MGFSAKPQQKDKQIINYPPSMEIEEERFIFENMHKPDEGLLRTVLCNNIYKIFPPSPPWVHFKFKSPLSVMDLCNVFFVWIQ